MRRATAARAAPPIRSAITTSNTSICPPVIALKFENKASCDGSVPLVPSDSPLPVSGLTYQKILLYTVAMTATASTDLDRAVALFHALSDATRLEALEMLRNGEKCVCELQDQLDVAQSRLSFHLKVLKDAGLVEDRKEGRWSYYSIVPNALDEAHDLVINFVPKSSGSRRTLRVIGSRAGGPMKSACCG